MKKLAPALIAALLEDYKSGLNYTQLREKHKVSKSTLSIYLKPLAQERAAKNIEATKERKILNRQHIIETKAARKEQSIYKKKNHITAQLRAQQICQICNKAFLHYFKKSSCSKECEAVYRSKNQIIRRETEGCTYLKGRMQYCLWCYKPFLAPFKRMTCSNACNRHVRSTVHWAIKKGLTVDFSIPDCLDKTCPNFSVYGDRFNCEGLEK